jgi:adenine C2-methylase RlmN of 23S rRNA A2503 and tRNA A37
MELSKKVESQTDNAIKYVFLTDDNRVVEFTYINKNDGKDIICVPCQTMCNLGCKFCHTTDFIGKIKVRNLSALEISDGIKFIYSNLNLKDNNIPLLISYMGVGEPMANVENVIESMRFIRDTTDGVVKFGVATCIPEKNIRDFFNFVFLVKERNLEVKLHFSLHYTDDITRREWMPAVLNIDPSIEALKFFYSYTGNDVEIHYALIKDINDKQINAYLLGVLFECTNFNVKFLHYNEKDSNNYKASTSVEYFMKKFDVSCVEYEIYTPPGLDIGSSCGAFLMDEYITEKK